MGKSKTHKEFIKELTEKNEAFRNGEFVVVGEYVAANTRIIVKTKYGDCKVTPSNLLKGQCPTISSAVNKTTFVTEQFKEVHRDTYGYNRVAYKGGKYNVEIYCKAHKEYFWQIPSSHLQGAGCKKCGVIKCIRRKSHKEFMDELYLNNKYFRDGNFSVLGKYAGQKEKILIKDKYGELLVHTSVLLKGSMATVSSAVNKTSYTIAKFEELHGDTYIYTDVDYIGAKEEVNIICKVHGLFSLQPTAHLSGWGCKNCVAINYGKKFINTSLKVHNGLYSYENVKYIDNSTKVDITCKIHGGFLQEPSNHVRGQGCKNCRDDGLSFDTEEYIRRARDIHGDTYDYNQVSYFRSSTKISIYCKIHGLFKTSPSKHLQGRGCPECGKELKGWSDSDWEKAGLSSKHFDGFKVYIIKCWNEEETFYKIGKTFTKIKSRFRLNGKDMPYNYEIVKIFKDEKNGVKISKLEKQLQNKNFSNKYIPNIEFKGISECFSKINKETLDFELN